MKPTYVLFAPGKAGPTVFHETIEDAREEAKRLTAECFIEKVMICQFIEGLQRISSVKPMKQNPLAKHGDMPF